jgi:hypothetical protein
MSASEFSGHCIEALAAEALTRYRFVDLAGTTAKEATKASIADSGDNPIGIVGDTVTTGRPVAVFTSGVGRLEVDGSGAAIAAGDYLKPDGGNAGKGIKAATDGNFYGARALEPSTADGDVIRVLIIQGMRGA